MAQQILAVIALVPEKKVASYGQIAKLAGLPRHARMVGKVLQQLDADSDIAWYRILNSQGKISTSRCNAQGENIQQIKLQQEGIVVLAGKVDLKQYRWQP